MRNMEMCNVVTDGCWKHLVINLMDAVVPVFQYWGLSIMVMGCFNFVLTVITA